MHPDLIMTAIGAVTFCLSLLLSAFLFAIRGPLRPANRLLAGFLLLTAVDLFGWTADLFPDGVQHFLIFRLPLSFLQMPLLCAYVGTLCFPKRRFHAHLLGGAIATLVSAASLIPRFLVVAFAAPSSRSIDTGLDLVANNIALHVQFYAYIAIMIALFVRSRRGDGRTDSPPDRFTATWIITIIAVSVAAHTLVVAKSWASIRGDETGFQTLQIAVGLFAVVITCALTLAALARQSLFLGLAAEAIMHRGKRGAAPSITIDEEATAHIERYMTAQKPFLDPSLTIGRLARRLGMTQRDLSGLINRQMGLHFFDFVNRYRIDMAAAMLVDPANDAMTVLEIAHLVGFNTKSSFNTAFGKHRGEAPTAHRLRAREVSRAEAR
ncbi:MAG: AraC family transcriptional regulator [Pseudomonadota bacterium]